MDDVHGTNGHPLDELRLVSPTGRFELNKAGPIIVRAREGRLRLPRGQMPIRFARCILRLSVLLPTERRSNETSRLQRFILFKRGGPSQFNEIAAPEPLCEPQGFERLEPSAEICPTRSARLRRSTNKELGRWSGYG